MMTKKQIEDTIHLLDLETMCCWETIKNAISGLYELLEYKDLEGVLGHVNKVLAALEDLFGSCDEFEYMSFYPEIEADYNIVKQYILKTQKQEKENTKYKKVLKIIKKKNVDIGYLRNCDNEEEYNLYISNYDNNYWRRQPLTQEEFDLLKRWSDEKKD